MTTTVLIVVREDGPEFHGTIAHIQTQGDGSPDQFRETMKAAMTQANIELPNAWRQRKPAPALMDESY